MDTSYLKVVMNLIVRYVMSNQMWEIIPTAKQPKIIDSLEELEDVKAVHSNYDIDEALLESINT